MLIFISILLLLINSRKIIFRDKLQNDQYCSFEKAWWVSTFLFIISQCFDVQYFDGRISIVFWILLAGIKTIIDENIQSI